MKFPPTNAVKYGALKEPGGRLVIRLSRLGDKLTVTWEEQGAMTAGSPAEPGFGPRCWTAPSVFS